MNQWNKAVWILGATLFVANAGTLQAASKDKAAQPDPMMAEMQKFATPGEAHKVLEPFIGRWTFVTRFWMKPGDKPQQSNGTSQNTWVYGNRFLKTDFTMDMQGQPMEGVGYTGYDNVLGEYVAVWLGSMGTSIMTSKGTYDAATKILKFSGKATCPMPGEKEKPFRAEWKWTDNDTFVYNHYMPGPDGKEFKMVEETYKRVK